MKLIVLIVVLLGCVGCDTDSQLPDQKLRREIFMQCLEKAPAGPQVTKYNDWSEVVNECGNQAYYMAFAGRKVSK